MNLCLRNVFVSLWLLYTTSISAQIGFTLPFLNNVTAGATVALPVKVYNFDSITSVQFVLRWNPAVLEFSSTDFYNLPGLDENDFGLMNTLDSGILRLAWEASDLELGETAADGTTIFRLRLKATGPVNAGSVVTFGSAPPTIFEVTQLVDGVITPFEMGDVNVTQGFVAIGYTVSANEPYGQSNLLPVQVAPNPFHEKTQVSFDLDTASDVQLAVTDESGRIILEKTMPELGRGQHGMEIASPELREKGMYYLILRTKNKSCVQPLFVF